MKTAVIYSRVSTDEQREQGFSLQDQEQRLAKYCRDSNIEIVRHFSEDYSAKNFNRPTFKNFLSLVKSGELKPNLLICIRHDRFSRNMEESLAMIATLMKYGIHVKFVENNVELDTPESKILYMLNMLLPEVDNARRGLNTKRGMRQARREGRWAGTPPRGYCWDRSSGNSLLVPDQTADLISKAFREFAKGNRTMEEIRRLLLKEGLTVSKNQFANILQNVVYVGKIRIESWNDEPEEIVQGLHPPLIDERTFYQVQDIRVGRKVQPAHKKRSSELPLRGHLKCPVCMRTLTGSKSRGNGGCYSYYHCSQKGHQYVSMDRVHESFLHYLKGIKMRPEVIELFDAVIKDVLKNDVHERRSQHTQVAKKIEEQESRLRRVEDEFADGSIDTATFTAMRQRYTQEIDNLKRTLGDLKTDKGDLQMFFSHALELFRQPDKLYQQLTMAGKEQFLGSIFQKKLVFDGKSFRTTKPSMILNLISLSAKEIMKIKKDSSSDESYKAPPPGLEPGTYGLTVRLALTLQS